MAILDTSFIIDYLWDIPSAISAFEQLENRNEVLRTTSINVYELVKGAEMSKSYERDISEINTLLKKVEILDFSDENARTAAKIFSELSREGKMVDDFDVMVAAVCLHVKDKIVTNNERDYQKIKGLEVETY